MYWSTMEDAIFPDMEFNAILTLTQFEDILKYKNYLASKDPHNQIMDFLFAGNYITLEELMIKAFYR